MKGMILAAGYGTRLRPLTYELPKPMVPLCNLPLIGYAVEALLRSGIDSIVVNLHHLPEQLQSYLPAAYGTRCQFEFSWEPKILGTGGGIRKVRDFLEDESDFALVNGDTIQAPDFARMRERLRKEASLAVLLLRHPPERDRFTKVFFEDDRVNGFGEGRGEALMFAGAHVISRRVFDFLPDRDFSGITEDVYMPVIRDAKETIGGVIDGGIWFDVGTPLRYFEASDAVRALMLRGGMDVPDASSTDGSTQSIVAAGAAISGTIAASVVGNDCKISSGAEVSHSVLLDGAQIESGSRVSHSIIGPGVVLAGATIDNAVVCREIEGEDYPEGHLRHSGLVAVAVDPAKKLTVES